MSEIKVSIIVPVYNTEKYFAGCIKSLVNQTLKDIEIIFVINGNSSAFMQDYVQNDKRIILVNREYKNQSEAYNTGIKIAKGEYLCFVNSDDWCEDDMCEKLYLRAKETDSDITTCLTTIYDGVTNIKNENSALFAVPEEFFDKVFSPVETLDFLFDTEIFNYNKIFKTSFLHKNNIFFTNMDEFSLNAWLISKKLTLVKDFLYNKRLKSDAEINFGDYVKKLNVLKAVLKKHDVYKKTRKAFKYYKAQTLQHCFYNIIRQKNKYVCILKLLSKIPYFIFDLLPNSFTDIKLLSKLYSSENKKIMFWGASIYLEKCLYKYHIQNDNIIGIIDKDKVKEGTFLQQYKCYMPDKIKELNPDEIIVTVVNGGNKRIKEIKKYLKENNLQHIKVFALNDGKKEFYQRVRHNIKKSFEKGILKIPLSKIKEKQLNEIISSISPQKKVYLFQRTYYDTAGKNFFSGGAERYVTDFSNLVCQLGYKPILIQNGNEHAEFPWIRTRNNLTIIGVNACDINNFYKIINNLDEPALAIYSGIVKWNTDIRYKNALLISHGITWDRYEENADIKFLKKLSGKFRSIISVDTNTISWFRSTFSCDIVSDKINFEYLPNYVDTDKFKPISAKRKQLKITYPRRCSEERGFWLFADIVPKLLEKYHDVLIEFVGYIHGDKINDSIKAMISKYPDNVTHRVVPQDKMYEVYQNTDISVIPTIYSEGTSLSCLEAMACGNTVVATNVGGLPNLIINNYNGKLVSPDENSVYNALEELINNPDKRTALSQNAVMVSKVFSKTLWDNSWLDILKKYLQEET